MEEAIAGLDWDEGNRSKCLKHGVSAEDVESVFLQPIMVLPDEAHSGAEARTKAIGKTAAGRYVFVVFTIRERKGKRYVRPISARNMHRKEIRHYEEENPNLQE